MRAFGSKFVIDDTASSGYVGLVKLSVEWRQKSGVWRCDHACGSSMSQSYGGGAVPNSASAEEVNAQRYA